MKKVLVNIGLMLLAMLLLPACNSNSEEEEYNSEKEEYQMQNGAFEGVVYEEGGYSSFLFSPFRFPHKRVASPLLGWLWQYVYDILLP